MSCFGVLVSRKFCRCLSSGSAGGVRRSARNAGKSKDVDMDHRGVLYIIASRSIGKSELIPQATETIVKPEKKQKSDATRR